MSAYTTAVIQEKLNLIKDIILSVVPDTEAIYLFGSYVDGAPHDDSDLDVCAIFPDYVSNLLELRGKIRSSLYRKLNMPMDLIVKKSSDFHTRKAGATLDRIIAENGVLIYG